MKTKTLLSLITTGLILFVFTSTKSFSQVWYENWERNPQNPIMDGPVNWTNNFSSPVIIHEDDTYKMWFTSGEWEIGYAASDDGFSWEIHQSPVIIAGNGNDWDYHKSADVVLRIDDTLRMWYSGIDSDWDPYRLGYAWSLDGIAWQLNEEPVLEGASFSSMHYDGTIFHLYYTSGWKEDINYATSEDGITWIKSTENNPVIERGAPGTWNDEWVTPRGLIMHNDTLHMFFDGRDGTADDYYNRTGYAWSVDYTNWTVNDNYVFDVVAGGWESEGVSAGTILFEDNKYKMWYGGSGSTGAAIGYAEIEIVSSVYESSIFTEVSTHPNPFKNSTTIEYELLKPSTIQLTIYDYLGKQVEVIEKKQAQGKQQIIWNAEGLPAGVYTCVLKTESETQTVKMIKMK